MLSSPEPSPSVTVDTALQSPHSGGASGERLDDTPLDKRTRRTRRIIFGIVATGLFMASLDMTIVATALPTIKHDLHARVNWAAWAITIYGLVQIVVMPLAGKLSDQFGRRKIFLLSIALFTATSLCCGFSRDIYMLVGLRAVQAIGGGAIMPVATGVISDAFGRDRDRAIGMFSSIFPMGGLVGPLLGGIFISFWSWRGIFFINVPIGIVLLSLAIRYVPESHGSNDKKVDVPGVAYLGVVILFGIFGITILGDANTAIWNPLFLASEAIAGLGIWRFLRHCRTVEHPFIPLRLLFGKGFGSINMLNLLFGAASFGTGQLVPLYAENRYGFDSLDASTLLTSRAVGMIAVAGLSAMLLRRTGTRWPMMVGYTGIALGLLLMAKAPVGGLTNYLWLSLAVAVFGIGSGIASPAANNAQMHLSPNDVASIAGLRGMFRGSGGIFAVSVTTSILARAHNQGLAQAHLYVALAALMLLALVPLRFVVQDHRGRW